MAVDPYIVLDDATAMIDEVYDTDPLVQQARFGATTQHMTRQKIWKGGAMHIKMINQVFSRSLSNSDLEADAPAAGKISTLDVKVEESNLRKLAFSLRHSIPAAMEVDGSDHAVWDLAKELVLQSEESIGEKRNQLIHQDANSVKALVKQKYNVDGTTFTPAATEAFIQIDNGSISSFHEGELVSFRKASTNVWRVHGVINDVWHDKYYRDLNIGPGFTVTYDTQGDTSVLDDGGGDVVFTNVVDNDEIVATGEADGMGYELGFDHLCNRSTPGAYFNVTNRATKGYQFLVPYGRTWSTVDLDVDTHFGVMADTMGMVFGPARAMRRARGFRMTDALVVVCQPDLLNEAARQVGEFSKQFTREMAQSMTAGRRANLVAVGGWEGVVLHHPSLPPLALQSEPLCKANTFRIFEPSCWEFIRMTGKRPTMIRQPGGGGIWHNRRNVTTGNLTMHVDASGFVIECPGCDQPRLMYSLEDVTTTL